MNVLIVDDDKLMRNVLSTMVNQAGHQAFAANGSSQALALVVATIRRQTRMSLFHRQTKRFTLQRVRAENATECIKTKNPREVKC